MVDVEGGGMMVMCPSGVRGSMGVINGMAEMTYG